MTSVIRRTLNGKRGRKMKRLHLVDNINPKADTTLQKDVQKTRKY